MNAVVSDVITPDQAVSLPGLFSERVRRSRDKLAYRFFDALNGTWTGVSWGDMDREVDRWRSALAAENLMPGDRVAIMARNSRFWVMFDLAALSRGLVVIPVYTEDRADNVAYLMDDAQVRLLVIGGAAQWERVGTRLRDVRSLRRIVSIADLHEHADGRLLSLPAWLERGQPAAAVIQKAKDLATIIYTSGTTGRPKGVMLSHQNVLSNAHACLQTITVSPGQVFLSFLPLSHALERTVGYYLPMMAGAVVAHARGIAELAEDLKSVRPEGLISVPRIYERFYSRLRQQLAQRPAYERWLFKLAVDTGWHRFLRRQGRAHPHPRQLLWPLLERKVASRVLDRLGGRLRVAVSGGAALSPDIARTFIGLGVPLLQGYGLTEASPVVSVNRLDDNVAGSIGLALPGVEVKVGAMDELLARGPNTMLGFWNRPEETARVLDPDGWLHTGDRARIDAQGHIFLTGRLKEIIVLANGEKVPPADMELAIIADPLFDQVMVIGDSRPFLSAVAVLNRDEWQRFAKEHQLDEADWNSPAAEQALLKRIAACLHEFPGYARILRLSCSEQPWSVDNGLLTPTLKTRRDQVQQHYAGDVDRMYSGHGGN